MRVMTRWFAFMIALVACTACGGPGPGDIASPRQIGDASGSPTIAQVVDIGDIARLPENGALPPADTDGAFVVGELVRIDGENFGKQPTVKIGKRPAKVVARTGSGAILTRIPTGVRTGDIEVQVTHAKGTAETSIAVLRYGLVVQSGAGKVHVLSIDRRGDAQVAGVIDIPGARDVAFSSDGQLAFVAAEAKRPHATARLALIALSAAGGPRLVHELRLSGTRASAIASAKDAGLAAIAAGGQVLLVDTRDPRNPAAYRPKSVGVAGDPAIAAVALSPDGKTLAALIPEGNLLVPVDVSRPNAPKPGTPLPLLPDDRMPLAIDLGFAPKKKRLYVLTGDNRASLAAGTHPARVLAIDTDAWTIAKQAEITGVGAPRSLAVAGREASPGGSAIQAGDDQAPLAMTAIDRALFAQDASAAQGGERSALTMPALAGPSQSLASDRGVLSDVAMSHDLRFTMASVVRTDGPSPTLGVLLSPTGNGTPSFVALGEAAGKQILNRAPVALAP